jgi:hypothetical protein
MENRLKTNNIEQQPVNKGIEQAGFLTIKANALPACCLYTA